MGEAVEKRNGVVCMVMISTVNDGYEEEMGMAGVHAMKDKWVWN